MKRALYKIGEVGGLRRQSRLDHELYASNFKAMALHVGITILVTPLVLWSLDYDYAWLVLLLIIGAYLILGFFALKSLPKPAILSTILPFVCYIPFMTASLAALVRGEELVSSTVDTVAYLYMFLNPALLLAYDEALAPISIESGSISFLAIMIALLSATTPSFALLMGAKIKMWLSAKPHKPQGLHNGRGKRQKFDETAFRNNWKSLAIHGCISLPTSALIVIWAIWGMIDRYPTLLFVLSMVAYVVLGTLFLQPATSARWRSVLSPFALPNFFFIAVLGAPFVGLWQGAIPAFFNSPNNDIWSFVSLPFAVLLPSFLLFCGLSVRAKIDHSQAAQESNPHTGGEDWLTEAVKKAQDNGQTPPHNN